MIFFEKIAFIIITLTLLFTICTNGQGYVINGLVKDTAGNPVEDASVSIVHSDNKAGILFSRTNEKGFFQLQENTLTNFFSNNYQLKISCIGYYTLFNTLENTRDSIVIVLKRNNEYLQNVVVKNGNDYISKKKDTISYTADKFIEKEDRLLKDLLKHLPGIEVSANGNVSYNGTAINKLYIEGQDLLDNHYNLATNNIGANAIDKIQVIEHNQHIKLLNGLVPSDQPGINIKLKNKNKLRTNYKLDLEGGFLSNYRTDISAFTYKQKYLGLNVFKMNNTGSLYSSQTTSNTGNDFYSLPMPILNLVGPSAPIEKERYLFNKSAFLSFNNFFVFKNDIILRTNGWLLKDKYDVESNTMNQYYLPNSSVASYFENRKDNSKLSNLSLQLSLLKNADSNYFSNNLVIENQNNIQSSYLLSNQGEVLQKLSSPYFKAVNTFEKIWLIHSKNRIQLTNYLSYYKEPQVFEVKPGTLKNVLNDSVDYTKAIQYIHIPSYFIDNNVKYFINKKYVKIFMQLGQAYQNQVFQSELKTMKLDSSINKLAGFTNNLNWRKLKIYNSNTISFQKNNAWLDIHLNYNFTHIGYRNNVDNANVKCFSKLLLEPFLVYRNKVGKENELSASVNFNNRIGTITDVFPNPVLVDYRSLNANEMPLYLGNNIFFNGVFKLKKTMKLFFANLNINGSVSNNSYILSQEIDSLRTTNIAIPQKNSSKSIGVEANLSKYIFPLSTTFSLNFGVKKTTTPLYQNQSLFNANASIISTNISISPKLYNWLKLDFNGGYSKTTVTSHNHIFVTTSSIIYTGNSAIVIYPYKSAIVNFSGSYYNYTRNKKSTGNFLIFDGYIQQTIKKKIDCRLTVKNLSNTTQFSSIILENNLVQGSTYTLLHSMYLVSFFFNL